MLPKTAYETVSPAPTVTDRQLYNIKQIPDLKNHQWCLGEIYEYFCASETACTLEAQREFWDTKFHELAGFCWKFWNLILQRQSDQFHFPDCFMR